MKRQFDLVAHLLLIAAVAVGMLAILRGRFAGGDQFLVIIEARKKNTIAIITTRSGI